MIIIDTREKKPLWDPNFFNVKKMKLDEGDYTTEELLNYAHIERKSGIDLYGSLIQNHNRFVAEIERAIEKNLLLSIFVECPRKNFIKKDFKGGYRLRVKPKILSKIIDTFENKYPVKFVWCEDRNHLRDKMCEWFVKQLKDKDRDLRKIEEDKELIRNIKNG